MTSIHQASYFPWQGLLNKIDKSDVFILLDAVQFSDGAYQNRNLFLDNKHKVHTLTIAIEKKNHLNKRMKDMRIVDKRWQTKHLKFLMQNYSKHPFYEEILTKIEPLYKKEYKYVIDVLQESMNLSCQLFEIDTEWIHQSTLPYDKEAKKSALVMDLLHKSGSTHYLSGLGAKAYQKDSTFEKNYIDLSYQNYKQIPYKQLGCDSFIAGLSSLDLLFNIGKDLAKNYI